MHSEGEQQLGTTVVWKNHGEFSTNKLLWEHVGESVV